MESYTLVNINTLRPRQNGRHFPDDIFKWIFLNEKVWIPIKISMKFVPKGPINNIPALVQIMAWRRPGDKPLAEQMMVSLTAHICVTRPQWVNSGGYKAQCFRELTDVKFESKCIIFFIANPLWNVVCKMAAISFRHQRVNSHYVKPILNKYNGLLFWLVFAIIWLGQVSNIYVFCC